MPTDLLAERRRWFRYFPEGSIEFLVATRILLLLLLLSMLMVRDVQRPTVIIALVVVGWLDAVLMIWWLVQVATDLALVSAGRIGASGAGSWTQEEKRLWSQRRWRAATWACVPMLCAALLLAPWPTFLRQYRPDVLPSATVLLIIRVSLAAVFVVSTVVGGRALRAIGLGPSLWAVLLMWPVLHWFAMHRLVVRMERRMVELAPASGERPGGLAVAIGDVSWVLSLVPWTMVMILTLTRGWPEGKVMAVPFCGMFMTGVFVIANVAAMERVQRHFLALLRKQPTT